MKKSRMDARAAVLMAKCEEEMQPWYEGKEAVLAACDLFLAITSLDDRIKMYIELNQPREPVEFHIRG